MDISSSRFATLQILCNRFELLIWWPPDSNNSLLNSWPCLSLNSAGGRSWWICNNSALTTNSGAAGASGVRVRLWILMSGIVEVIKNLKLQLQMQQWILILAKVSLCLLWFWLQVSLSFSVLFWSLPISAFPVQCLQISRGSLLSVWLWLQNFNSKPNMLIYLWTKAWISQFVACHWERVTERSC